MKPIGIFYATREGHTRGIAERAAAALRENAIAAEIYNVGEPHDVPPLDRFSGALLAASVHSGRHEAEMIRFVKTNRRQLEAMPSAFVSVTLSEAGAERPDTTPQQHQQFAADVQHTLDRFFHDTGWHPDLVKPVAGALLYTRYNMLVRFIMKGIARKSGGDTDTSRDHVYTDWQALDVFVREFAKTTSAAVV